MLQTEHAEEQRAAPFSPLVFPTGKVFCLCPHKKQTLSHNSFKVWVGLASGVPRGGAKCYVFQAPEMPCKTVPPLDLQRPFVATRAKWKRQPGLVYIYMKACRTLTSD